MKSKGTLWMIVGLLLLAAALFLVIRNMDEDRLAGDASEQVSQVLFQEILQDREENEDLSGLPASSIQEIILPEGPVPEMPVKIVNGKEYVAMLSLPTLDLELPVINEWSYPNLRSAPCRFSGSVYTNDFVVCGHNYGKHFGSLRNLSLGDEVDVVDMDGNAFRYEVVGLETLRPTDVDLMVDGDDWDLTLFTCTVGGRTRITVRCALVEDD